MSLLRVLLLFPLLTRHSHAASEEESPPVITEHPLDVIVSKGSPATLNCAAKPPGAEIVWFKDGVQVTTNKDQVNSHRIILDTGALFLLKVNSGKNGKDGDSGSYYCVAKNKYGEAQSREGTLKIAMLRDDFRTRPRNMQALSGDKAVLTCSPPKGFPEPVVTWRKDDRELRIQDDPRLTLHPDGDLIIQPVQHSDSGTYQCVATNMVGERESNPARLSVYEKPVFLQEPRDVTVEVGQSVLFDCRVSGEPQPQISWKKRNDQMPVARAYIAKDNRGLRIDRVMEADEGEYVCYAKNPAGSIESSARLRVTAPPTFRRRPADVSIAQGATATFDCAAIGQPPPALFWSREGQQNLLFPGHISEDGRVKVEPDGRMTISDVRPVDEGNYVCAAMNSAGSSLAKAALRLSSRSISTVPPPIIEHGHSNQTLMVSTSAILPCQATGRKPPTISWLRNGQTIDLEAEEFSDRYKLVSGSLHVSDLRKTDSGVYTCRAMNDDGEAIWTASLNVEEHNTKAIFQRMPDPSTFPSRPTQPVPSNVSEDGVDLEWSAPERNGATPVSGYMLQYFSPEMGETWYNVPDYISGTKHRVRGLNPNQTYVFLVRAENDNGIGPPSPVSTPIRTNAQRPDVEKEIATLHMDLDEARRRLTSEQLIKLEEVRAINSTAVRLSWKRRKVEDLVQGYYIKWRGPPLASAAYGAERWVNVSGADTETYVVNGLLPYTNYEFFVIPYHKTVQGTPSNSMDGTTDEAPPSLPPSNVRIQMLNLTTLLIAWSAPPADGINGILKGYQIVVIGRGSKYNRNITTNERAAKVTLFHLVPDMAYKIRVAARNNAGIGVYHGTDIVTMNQETLERHNAMREDNESLILALFRRSWFVVLLTVLIWFALIGLAVFIYTRYRKSRGTKTHLGPFIKINDGSVHLAGMNGRGNEGLWADGFATAPRVCAVQQPLYSLTPNQHDFYPPQPHMEYDQTLPRPGSEHHYHYAQLTGPASVGTYYGHYQDDPSPYATTTLIGTNGAPPPATWLSDHMLRGPVVPPGPIPNGPPPRFADSATGRRSRSSRHSNDTAGSAHRSHPLHANSDSPPHTDISYVQSSDGNGTGGSSHGQRSRPGTLNGKRTPPRQTLMDFIPPPPPGAPPPEENLYDMSEPRRLGNYAMPPEALLHERSQDESRYSRVPPEITGRPTSRSRVNGYRSSRGVRNGEDDDSQRSSLIDDHERRFSTSSSEADEENSESEAPRRRRRGVDAPAPVSSSSSNGSAPRAVPCMGVSASTISQSALYDANGSRFKSMPRKKEVV